MKIRPTRTLAFLVLLTGCSSPSDPIVGVSEVRVSPTAPSTDVGLTVQFTAQGISATGQAIQGLEVTWSADPPDIASISSTGLATGLAVGAATVTATIGGVSGSQTLEVEPNECTNRVDVVLSTGQFQTYPGTQCLLLPAGQANDRYRVAVVRPTLIEDDADVPTVALEINPVLSAAQAPIAVPPSRVTASAPDAAGLPAALERIDGASLVRDLERMNATREFHRELREQERALGLASLTPLPNRRASGPALTSHPDPPTRRDMYTGLDCTDVVTSPVLRIGFNDDLVLYQDSVEWSSTPLPQAAANLLFNYYQNHTKQMVSDYFGPPSDVDGDGRVIIVTSADVPSNAAAGVWSGDFLSPISCPASNQAEVIYFAGDVLQDLVAADPSYLALSVLAHEMKHVVSLYNGVRRGSFHNTWIEEGTAEVAQTMSSRIAWAATGGPAVGQAINGADIVDAVQANNGEISPEMWGLVGELAELIVNLSTQPNSLITNPNGSNNSHTFYAAAWHFFRYIGDAYGNASTPFADAPIFRTLTDSLTGPGTQALATATGRSFDELFEEVVVATSTHLQLQTPPPGIATWDLLSATDIFVSPPEVAPPGIYPWPVTGDDASPNAEFVSATFSGPIGPSGVRYHDFVSNGQGLGAQILVTGAATGQIIVTRLR